MAMGCSTNAIIHLIAQARRAGHDITLDDFEKASRKVPVVANVRPSGDKYLMEDFFYAGGLPGLMSRIWEHLHLDVMTVTGQSLGDNIARAEVYNDDVIRTVKDPIYAEGALAVLKSNLAPEGCVIKPSACVPRVSPESYIGGPRALVRNGDKITLDVNARTINLDVPEAELAKRRAGWKEPKPRYERGYGWMFTRHIKQANEGCDFDFLETGFGAPVDEPSIY